MFTLLFDQFRFKLQVIMCLLWALATVSVRCSNPLWGCSDHVPHGDQSGIWAVICAFSMEIIQCADQNQIHTVHNKVHRAVILNYFHLISPVFNSSLECSFSVLHPECWSFSNPVSNLDVHYCDCVYTRDQVARGLRERVNLLPTLLEL